MPAGQRDEVHIGAVGEGLADPLTRSEHQGHDPGGTPASSNSRVRAMVVSGVIWAGFMTAVLPAARAGAIFQLIWSSG